MSTPRYVPRDFCMEPRRFGRGEDVSWRRMTPANGPTEHAQYIAARHQHQNTLKLRRGLKELGLSTEAFASLAGVSYDRMAKMLRGVLIMRLEDIAMAEYLVHRPLRDREQGS